MRHTIENEYLRVTVDEQGAELTSLVRKSDNNQILWQGDKAYWQGQSPILFPAIGNSAYQTALFDGKEYPMPKHGLVRRMQFQVVEKNLDSIVLMVTDTEETRQHFPMSFRLAVRYKINDNDLRVEFHVTNDNEAPLPFHIGAHPAFNLPDFKESDMIHGYMKFDVEDYLLSDGLKPGGLRWEDGAFKVLLNDGMLELNNQTFSCDTILDTRGLAHACVLYNKERGRIVSVKFDAPVLALWAPKGGCCPFVCIEPWWGCCDDYGFCGEFSQRHWINIARKGETKVIEYTITVH